MTVRELKAELKANSWSTTGAKDSLVERVGIKRAMEASAFRALQPHIVAWDPILPMPTVEG